MRIYRNNFYLTFINKLNPFIYHISMCLVLRTIGVYHPHDMCEALARYVRSINTSAYDKKKAAL
nr:hypothetical protein [uncultured Prevotella sp.]